jgi:membrane-bound lytic murein transglycosylase MltF
MKTAHRTRDNPMPFQDASAREVISMWPSRSRIFSLSFVLLPIVLVLIAVAFFIKFTPQAPEVQTDYGEEPYDPILARALAPWTGDLDGILERGLLRVAIPYGLSTYFIDGPVQKGLTYERVMGFEAALKKALGEKAANLTLVIVPTNLSRWLPMLIEGRADLAAGNLTITDERRALVDFSNPFLTGMREVLITGPAAPDVRTADDLLTSAVHVRRSSSFFEHLAAFNAERVATGKAALPVVLANENLSTEDLIEEVNAGLVPATIADEPVAALFAQIFGNVRVHDDLIVASDQEIGWAMRKGSPKLKALVNDYVPEAREGSKLGNVLINRYLHNVEWAKNALAAEDRARFQNVADLVKKYADRHRFDWLMIAAQGYQESGLDQSKRSPVGAVGVMQVMPATALDPNVGIPDIHLLEPNIHAGVKYLGFLRDRYFSDPALSDLDRTLFSFAAYNAGPGSVARARRQAVELGLDPDVWFDNVEIAAAKTISREPVVYVRNIYKYYLAYKLVSKGRTGGPT